MRGKKWLSRMAFSLGIVAYLVVSSVLLVFYGPFEHLRSMVVGSILTSRHPQYAEFFLSSAELKKYKPLDINTFANNDKNLANFSNVTNDTIQVLPIDDNLFTGKLMIVSDPKRIKVAVTQHLNDVGELVSEMAQRDNAVAAINAGGFYDVAGRGTGGIPIGLTISDGKTIVPPTGDAVIGFTKQGALVVGKYSNAELQKLDLAQAISFGPQLISDGKGMITDGDGGWGRSARTAIGQRADGSVLLLVVEGRGAGGIGASLADLQQIMLDNGAVTAANLDGGFSSEMWENGQFLVPPSNPLGERPVATAILVTQPSKGGGSGK